MNPAIRQQLARPVPETKSPPTNPDQKDVNKSKTILLLKRPLKQDEFDLLSSFISFTVFNENAHTGRYLPDLLVNDMLIVPLHKKLCREWYEVNQKLIDPTTTNIICLEKRGKKIDPETNKQYGQSFNRKKLPENATTKEDFLFQLLSDHLPKITLSLLDKVKDMNCCK